MFGHNKTMTSSITKVH